MELTGKPKSVWIATAPSTQFPALGGDVSVDVAIVGGGITGLTAAFLLKRAGKAVAVIDRGRVATGETALTTAHLTEVVDGRYKDLVGDFGGEGARLATDAGRAAIEQIEALVHERQLACGFSRVPAYLYTERQEDVSRLEEELHHMRLAGVPASLTRDVPLPFATAAGLQIPNQAQFHPRQYLLPIAHAIPGSASHIFERTQVVDIVDGDPCRVETTHGTVTAPAVIVAANVPINNKVFLHTKLAAYRSYAIAIRVKKTQAVEGLFWDTGDPYHYIRTQPAARSSVLIIGGEDHKVGEEQNSDEPYLKLDEYARARFGTDTISFRWSGQIIEPVDGLPFIGRNPLSERIYVATGYSGNGMTFGTLAAMLLTDLVLGRRNPYADLLDARRVKPLASAADYVTENKDFLIDLAEHRLTSRNADTTRFADVGPGEGKIVVHNGEKYAVYRDAHHRAHVLSPVCTHLYCDVSWNAAEKSWDCPCHGSRFSPDGKVINGPATKDLARKELPAPVDEGLRAEG